jgi:hypothetical protein
MSPYGASLAIAPGQKLPPVKIEKTIIPPTIYDRFQTQRSINHRFPSQRSVPKSTIGSKLFLQLILAFDTPSLPDL